MQDYFRFYVSEKNPNVVVEKSNYVFQNRDNKITIFDALPFLVFHYVTDYNLDDLELFFRLAGFSAFTIEEMPDEITIPKVMPLPLKGNAPLGWLLGYKTNEEPLERIKLSLGEDIIDTYRNVKKQQLSYQKAKLEEVTEKETTLSL